MPNEAAPESTQIAAPAAAPEPAATPSAPESTAGPDSAAPAPDAAAPEPKPEAKPEPRLLSQDEVNRIVRRERRAAEDRAYQRARLEAENEQLRQQLGKPRGDQPNATQGTGERPRADQFKDWDSYQEALTDWKVDQKLAGLAEKGTKAREQTSKAEYAQEVTSKLADGLDKYDDFESVVGAPDVAFTDAMVDALIRTKAPADVAYHLGQNPKESQRIARLPLAEQVFAIRDLADKLTQPPAPTKAPEPIKPNSGNAAGVEPSLDAVAGNYKEWKRLRERQLAQKT
ncbi:MAG: hypothetical protein QG602_2332 [Verrucomicrobiota bacterium]|nr:hypothetical protein [Verrucomicrobiota bacterium]